MIPSLDVVLYACVAKSAAILAEFARNSDLVALGNRCIDCAPAFHSEFSHTCRNTTYTFLIDRPFVFFGIFDGSIAKTERFGFLGRIKSSFLGLVERGLAVDLENLNRYALQKEFEGIIQGIVNPVGSLASESQGHVRVRVMHEVHVGEDGLDAARGNLEKGGAGVRASRTDELEVGVELKSLSGTYLIADKVQQKGPDAAGHTDLMAN